MLRRLSRLGAQSGTRIHAPSMRRVRSRAVDWIGRLAEVVVACLILTTTFPMLIFVAVAIRWETPGPILEQRERVNRGRRFQMLKFRTTGHYPRNPARPWAEKTTQVGRFLRRTHIDSLPRLINVLRGEMSLADCFLSD